MSKLEVSKKTKKKKLKSRKGIGGRPTVMTPEVIGKLEACFMKGYNDYEAYNFVGISRDTFYEYKRANPKFADKVEWLKANTTILAKEAVHEKILEKDILTSKWYLERKAKDEFSTRVESTAKDGKDFEFTQLQFIKGKEIVLK